MSSPEQFDDTTAAMQALELAADGAPVTFAGPSVEIIDSSGPSLIDATTSLLRTRLKVVSILLLLVFGMILFWSLMGTLGTAGVHRIVGVIRLLVVGAVLFVLSIRQTFNQDFLRGLEYTLFGLLTVLWVVIRYEAIYVDASGGSITELLLEGRTSMIGLFLLMVVHGIFIPHRWQETARVVLAMSLAPVLVLVLFEARYPVLASQVAPLMSWNYVSTNVLVLLVGVVLATYTSHTLNQLRQEIRAGQEHGQYRLVTRLGTGGMGDVFLAEQMLFKRPCALKLIRGDAFADAAALARFERDVKATASLTHPHTIEIYDYGHTNDGKFYYVMEYLPGLSLGQLLTDFGPLPPGRVIYLLRQVCNALAEAHAAGLIHHALKPGNLYISERGGLCDFVKVLDFGLVKDAEQPGAAPADCISDESLYMSPEQASGSDPNARCDVYAVGAIAYHMLSGRPPFQKDSIASTVKAHAHNDVPPLSDHAAGIPDDVQHVVLRCLEKSPDDRYVDAKELEQALADCADASLWDAQQAAIWWHRVCFDRETG